MIQTKQSSSSHHCHFPGCKKHVPPRLWGCPQHWAVLPQQLKDAVWWAYRPGQEITKTPSESYLMVAAVVQKWCVGAYGTKIRVGPTSFRALNLEERNTLTASLVVQMEAWFTSKGIELPASCKATPEQHRVHEEAVARSKERAAPKRTALKVEQVKL